VRITNCICYPSQLEGAAFQFDKHSRTSDQLGDPRETEEPDSLGG